jgi:hypothetical protein
MVAESRRRAPRRTHGVDDGGVAAGTGRRKAAPLARDAPEVGVDHFPRGVEGLLDIASERDGIESGDLLLEGLAPRDARRPGARTRW